MKRFLLTVGLALGLFSCIDSAAQTLYFWTDDPSCLPVRVYVDQQFVGEVTEAYPDGLDVNVMSNDPGCLRVRVTPDRHKISAVNVYGEIYDYWPSYIRPKVEDINNLKMRSSGFVPVASSRMDYYAWMFVDWDPMPRHMHHHHHSDFGDPDVPVHRNFAKEFDPSSNDELVIAMAVAAFGGIASMTVAAVRNWKFPDQRFPYLAAGYNFNYLYGIDAYRNVATVKARLGNLGGMSLIADAGVTTSVLPYLRPASGMPYTNFTWSVGFTFDYAGFGFGLKYKPAFSEKTETFLLAVLNYDIQIGSHVIFDLGTGFGVSGYGRNTDAYSGYMKDAAGQDVWIKGGMLQHFEFPLTIGLAYKF